MHLVEHTELLTRLVGQWPSFHDAEVSRLVLDRTGPDGPTIEAHIQVESFGKHANVVLRFTEVAALDLGGFNNQNVLFDLEFKGLDATENEGRRIQVDLNASYGLAATFACARALVLTAEPSGAAA